MLLQNWWYTSLLGKPYHKIDSLREHISCDVLVVGGGMSGVSAAHALMNKGLKVVLIEKNILGGSSTGKSAGFLTPDSELELSQLIRRFGVNGAKELWEVPVKGISLIKQNVEKYNLDCDFQKQDSLFLGIGKSGWQDVQDELESRNKAGFESKIYNEQELKNIIHATGYSGAVSYANTYGISGLQYCQAMKNILTDAGIQVYEATEALRIEDHTVFTHAGSVKADKIIICIDKMTHSFSHFADDVFHAQTFLSISEPLSDKEIESIFPSGQKFQCWDSTLVYSYFRLTGNNRMLLGGGSAFTTFLSKEVHSATVIDEVITKFKQFFPSLNHLKFIQYWPGQIDTTRDLLPTLVRDDKTPYLHFCFGVVGLPWASFCGNFLAECVLGTNVPEQKKYFEYFSSRRPFAFPIWIEKMFGKPVLFSLDNYWAKYHQIDIKDKMQYDKKDF